MATEDFRCTVLVIEDYEDTRRITNLMVEMQGCRVVEAEDGREGLRLALAELPDLILMDVHMPGLNGIETTKRMRQQEALRDVPIVAISADSSLKAKTEILAAGCNDYLEKPLSFTKLESIMERYDLRK